jgi:hypothetical protein
MVSARYILPQQARRFQWYRLGDAPKAYIKQIQLKIIAKNHVGVIPLTLDGAMERVYNNFSNHMHMFNMLSG